MAVKYRKIVFRVQLYTHLVNQKLVVIERRIDKKLIILIKHCKFFYQSKIVFWHLIIPNLIKLVVLEDSKRLKSKKKFSNMKRTH